jgi:3-keto-5-aminohexanoate cleavage enzyme
MDLPLEHAPKLIVNLACTGMVPTREDSPHVPLTPAEIAEDCGRCYDAGASILHVHARDPEGRATWRPEVYREVILRVRRRCPGVIVCASTSGRVYNRFEERSAVLDLEGDARPDMASLTLGSLNFPKQASVNEPAVICALAEKMQARGIVPELEVFDLGMIDFAGYLIRKGILRPPFYFNLLLGSLGTLAATPFRLATLAGSLPPETTWSGGGIGRYQFPMNAMAVAMGGHVRVGLEDCLFMDAQKRRPATNLELVARVTRVAASVERQVASPAEARQIIGLPTRHA